MADEIIIGGYRRLGIMQVGQNSEVWEVAEVGGNRRFAMKLLLPEKVSAPEQRKMLRHEAAIGMKLNHPRIIRVLSFHDDKAAPFLLMEYFPSQNLKLRLLRGQYEDFIRPRLRPLLEQIAGAVGYLHEKKYVHRDVKPDNVLVSSTGEIRLIDFALAVKAASGFARKFARRRTAAGTRSYMSPEQIRGLPLDARADVYSLGVMIYEIVAGKLPFIGQTGDDLLRKHLSADVPAIDPARKVTREFEVLINKMLQKKEKDRLPSVPEFLSALRTMKIFDDEEMPAVGQAG